MSYNWGLNESNERELLRVSIVNEDGQLVFDSIIQPSKAIKTVPVFSMHLYDPSFGVPIRYLSQVLHQIFDNRVVVGYQLNKLLELLNLTAVYQTRDLLVSKELSAPIESLEQDLNKGLAYEVQTPATMAKTFFDISMDPYFRSTITEARVYMSLYKNF